MYARFMWDLPRFLRKRLTLDDTRTWIANKLANREEGFLRLVQRGIYSHPKSPYRFLLKEAGCEYGDLVKLVGDEGLEGALVTLYDRGVYVSFDEFKGRRAIVRGSQTLDTVVEDFDNPHRGPIMSPKPEARQASERASEWSSTTFSRALTPTCWASPRMGC